MTRLEELKIKKNAALIVVLTLGLAGLYQIQSFRDIWRSNIFSGTSLSENTGVGFILKVISFVFITILIAVPMFVIYFFRLIYYHIEIIKLARHENQRNRLTQQYYRQPMSIRRDEMANCGNIELFDVLYYYRENNQLYGPFSISELVDLDIGEDTMLSVNNAENWHAAREIDNLLSTLSLMTKLKERKLIQDLREC